MTYLPSGADPMFQENPKVTLEPAGTFSETADAIVYDVRFVAVIVS